MGASKRYLVTIDGQVFFEGSIRTSQIVYDQLCKLLDYLDSHSFISSKPTVLLSFAFPPF